MRTVQEIDEHVSKVFATAELSELDEMVRELEEHGTDEALALKCIIAGNAAYRREVMDVAEAECREAIDRYEALQHKEGMARASLNLGRVYAYLGDNKAAESMYMQAIDLYTQSGNPSRALRARVNVGLMREAIGDLDTALEILRSSVAVAIELGDDHALGNIYNGLGRVYLGQDDYGQATEYYRRAIDVHERLGEHSSVGNALNSLAIIHFYVGDYVAAAELWHKVLDEAIARGARNAVSTTLHNLGNLHDSFGEKDQALQCYERSREIGLAQQQHEIVLHADEKIGGLYCELGRAEEGAALIERCIEAYQQLGRDEDVVQASTSLAGHMLNMDRHDRVRVLLASIEHLPHSASQHVGTLRVRAELALHDQDPTSARDHLLEALSISEQINRTPSTARIHLDLRDVYKQLNDFDGYIRHNELWTKINDEIKGTKVSQQLATQAAERRIAEERLEHQKHLAVLHSTLPKHIADRVARGEQVQDHYDHAAIMFIDIVGFTTLASSLHASELANLLDTVFGICDAACTAHGLTKIKTIGDSYLAVAFPDDVHHDVPHSVRNDSVAVRAAKAALEIVAKVSQPFSTILPYLSEHLLANLLANQPEGLQVRVGLHFGPVFAGVIGKDRLQYDIWGDSVNVASRLESTGAPGRVHISDAIYNALAPVTGNRELGTGNVAPGTWHLAPGTWHLAPGTWHMAPGTWHLELRGLTDLKGKGEMTTYWLDPS